MSFNYIEAQATAKELVEFFGEPNSFVLLGVKGGFDPLTGEVTQDTPDTLINGTVTPLLDYDTTSSNGSYEVNGSMIQAGDKYCFFDSVDDVVIGMMLVINGAEWRAQSVVRLDSAAGVKIYQKIQLRR